MEMTELAVMSILSVAKSFRFGCIGTSQDIWQTSS